jgi:hypothetical protein
MRAPTWWRRPALPEMRRRATVLPLVGRSLDAPRPKGSPPSRRPPARRLRWRPLRPAPAWWRRPAFLDRGGAAHRAPAGARSLGAPRPHGSPPPGPAAFAPTLGRRPAFSMHRRAAVLSRVLARFPSAARDTTPRRPPSRRLRRRPASLAPTWGARPALADAAPLHRAPAGVPSLDAPRPHAAPPPRRPPARRRRQPLRPGGLAFRPLIPRPSIELPRLMVALPCAPRLRRSSSVRREAEKVGGGKTIRDRPHHQARGSCGLSAGGMRNWEQAHKRPDPSARVLMKGIERAPAAVGRALPAV